MGHHHPPSRTDIIRTPHTFLVLIALVLAMFLTPSQGNARDMVTSNCNTPLVRLTIEGANGRAEEVGKEGGRVDVRLQAHRPCCLFPPSLIIGQIREIIRCQWLDVKEDICVWDEGLGGGMLFSSAGLPHTTHTKYSPPCPLYPQHHNEHLNPFTINHHKTRRPAPESWAPSQSPPPSAFLSPAQASSSPPSPPRPRPSSTHPAKSSSSPYPESVAKSHGKLPAGPPLPPVPAAQATNARLPGAPSSSCPLTP